MSAHILRLNFDGWLRVEAVCNEPPGANCRLTSVSCECEYWGPIDRRGDGTIWHRVIDEGPIEPLWHEVKPADYCNVCEYLNNDDILECATPNATFTLADMPIEVTWNGDGYEWEPTP